MFDAIIIGAGPCGLTCATYLKRFGRNVLLVHNNNGVLDNDKIEIENYFGSPLVSGKSLILNSLVKIKELGVEVVDEMVVNIQAESDKVIVTTHDKTFEAKKLCLAIGIPKAKVHIPNIRKYEGIGVSYCAICDGFFFKDRPIGLYGNGEYLLHELSILKQVTNDITIFTKDKINDPSVKVVDDDIVGIIGDDMFEGIKTTNDQYKLDGLFIASGTPGLSALSRKVGFELKDGYIKVNELFQTNIENIYAGGDAIGGIKQITKASYDGMMIAMNINDSMKVVKHEQ